MNYIEVLNLLVYWSHRDEYTERYNRAIELKYKNKYK